MTGQGVIEYESLAQEALRSVVRTVLSRVAQYDKLPGNHHFYISFNTQAEGVGLSKRLRDQYPEEMTIVLQHRFWDLEVHDDRFEVKLTFNSIPERLVIPFKAIRVFFDPSVPYGLQFEDVSMQALGARRLPKFTGPSNRTGPGTPSERLEADNTPPAPPVLVEEEPASRQAPPSRPAPNLTAVAKAEPPAEEPKPTAEIVKLDAFRKK